MQVGRCAGFGEQVMQCRREGGIDADAATVTKSDSVHNKGSRRLRATKPTVDLKVAQVRIQRTKD